MNPMSAAPRDGRPILVLGPRGWRRARFLDCEWLRQPFEWDEAERRYRLPGDQGITDCWRCDDGNDIELDEARGWKPARDRTER